MLHTQTLRKAPEGQYLSRLGSPCASLKHAEAVKAARPECMTENALCHRVEVAELTSYDLTKLGTRITTRSCFASGRAATSGGIYLPPMTRAKGSTKPDRQPYRCSNALSRKALQPRWDGTRYTREECDSTAYTGTDGCKSPPID